MIDYFKEVYNKEKNENTAFVLMLGVLSEKLTEINLEIEKTNKLLTEMLTNNKVAKIGSKKEVIIIEPLTPEDYME
jgi:hypothetical protein